MKFNKSIIIMFIISILCVGGLAYLVVDSSQYTEYEYKLYEISDDVYGTYNTVVSSIPAQNYDMITLCCNGQIRTFKGDVYITYTDSDPYMLHKDSKLVNADILYVYVPFGTIIYQSATGIGNRR